MDGGVVSNLPVEPALDQGAKEIIAFDLLDSREVLTEAHGFGPTLFKVLESVTQRQQQLELKLAQACGVRVRRLPLRGEKPAPLLDFGNVAQLITQGYRITRNEMVGWRVDCPFGWLSWFFNLLHWQTEQKGIHPMPAVSFKKSSLRFFC